ncbi:MAG: hypothetical protein Q9160_002031 [Pyrenula sp. 1 TL-2023]
MSGNLPRLYETNRERGQYVALSHCWGGYQNCKTETTNIEQRRNGIELSQMPQNFSDAVFLTAKLGIRYLWIDSLCIIQDDKQDWESQAAQMTSIYRDSYLTVAASVAPNSPHGFLVPRTNAELHRGIVPTGPSGEKLPFPLDRIRVRRSLHDRRQKWLGTGNADPLDSRLWALQERLMPTRVLSYRHSEMTWECKTAQGCECYGLEEEDIDDEVQTWERELYHELIDGRSKAEKKKKRSDPSHNNSDLFRWWYRGLQTVTSRSLTFDSDRLPAISGIAGSVQAATGDTYLAGIWKSDLPNSLRWHVSPWKRDKKMAETKVPEAYRAPSWAWSSITATIVTPGPRDNRTSRIKVIDARCTPASNNNPFGWTSDGYIDLEGYVFSGTVTRSPSSGSKTPSSQTVLRISDLPPPLEDLKIDTSDFRSDTILVEAKAPGTAEASKEDLTTPTRSNLSWYLDSAPALNCPVRCLLLNTSNGEAFSDASEFIVLGRSLRVSGAWERVGFVDVRMKSPFKDDLTNVIEGLELTRLRIV